MEAIISPERNPSLSTRNRSSMSSRSIHHPPRRPSPRCRCFRRKPLAPRRAAGSALIARPRRLEDERVDVGLVVEEVDRRAQPPHPVGVALRDADAPLAEAGEEICVLPRAAYRGENDDSRSAPDLAGE